MTSPDSPRSSDPLFGNAATDLLGVAAGSGGQPPSDPHQWQPPTVEELQSRLDGYIVEAFLARGGMGAVYRGVQTSLERPVAIKILPSLLSEHDASFAQRFKQEARAMALLNHPGIVKVYDFGEMSDGTLYFIMEFIDGENVGQMIARKGRLSSAHAMAITAHVCDALQYAHQSGIIHRDIKPANIMVGNDGTVKVADFGLAKTFNSGHTSLTMTGHVMGTLNFMAPETLMLGSAVDHRADIYAVGVMLYQMLTGRLPQGIFEMPSLLVPGLDPRFDAIIVAAMREDRNARYQAIYQMRYALDAIMTQPVAITQAAPPPQPAAVPAQNAPPRPQPRQPYQRPPQKAKTAPVTKKKSSAAIWLIAAAIVLSLGGVVWMQMGKSEPVSAPASSHGSLGELVIPTTQFQDATIPEVLEYFQIKSRDLDPAKKGITILADEATRNSPAKISMDIKEAKLADLLAYIADIYDAEVAYIADAFFLQPRSTKLQQLDPWAVHTFGEAGKVIIPSVTFQNATIEEAVEYLTLKSRDLDPQKKGMVILLDDAARRSAGKITFDSKNITAANAIAQVSVTAGLEIFKVRDAARLRAPSKPKQSASVPNTPPPQTPTSSIELRPSRDDGDPSAVRFINKLTEEVKIQLVRVNGSLGSPMSIQAGKTKNQRTYIGHVWLITAQNGSRIGLVESTADNSIATIGTRGVQVREEVPPTHESQQLVSMVQLTGSNIGDAVTHIRQRIAEAGLKAQIELDQRVDPKLGSINLDARLGPLEDILRMSARQAGMRTEQRDSTYRIIPR